VIAGAEGSVDWYFWGPVFGPVGRLIKQHWVHLNWPEDCLNWTEDCEDC
jgi:hypothetical protein